MGLKLGSRTTALLHTFSLDNNAFALNFKTVYTCKGKVVTGRSGADLKVTETGGKGKKKKFRKIKPSEQGKIKKREFTHRACCNSCTSH